MIAAAHVHTIKKYGPDRVAGFSPIPAMSMVSHAAGARFMALIGAPMLSFYDWYADLPVASPQVFGDQTDVPESGDWWDASYLMLWGSNVPVTRTPDAHWMTEARYRGQKVVVCSPDYSDATKFADEWLAPAPGTDGALALAMGHVILREFFVERQTPLFTDYVKRFTDAPCLVLLEEQPDGYAPGRFLTAADLDGDAAQASEHADFKTVVFDAAGRPVVPNGSLGFRYGDEDEGRWNLDLGEVDPQLSLLDGSDDAVSVVLPRFDSADGSATTMLRGVPVRTVGGRLVTTVFDLLLASYGVGRPGLPGEWPTGYDDPSAPATPAWQEAHTGVPAHLAERIGREFAQNALDSGGRSMIIMGAGTNHYFHSDTIYRAFLTLTTLTACQGKNGGGWAHYVGQEKVRPLSGHSLIATANDWQRPPRTMIGTAYFYLTTDQWRYDTFRADAFAAPTGRGEFTGRTVADLVAASARMGWMPSYPTFNWNPRPARSRAPRPRAVRPARADGRSAVSDISGGELFLWVVVPYLAIATFVLGHIWRYRYDKFGWTTRSSQMYERRLLRWASPLFHFGLLLAIGGHVIGILVPESATRAIGLSETGYHALAATLGTLAGLGTVIGMALLIYRRRTVGPVFSATTRNDKAMYVLLSATILIGLATTLRGNGPGAHDYRLDVAPYFWSVFYGDPRVHLIASAPLGFQIHVVLAWLLFGFWPFTRLVHVFSAPIGYLTRPYIVYRSRETTQLGVRATRRGWERLPTSGTTQQR
jgi:nitrate reductase alpha subunit